jgi:hypothetical protein
VKQRALWSVVTTQPVELPAARSIGASMPSTRSGANRPAPQHHTDSSSRIAHANHPPAARRAAERGASGSGGASGIRRCSGAGTSAIGSGVSTSPGVAQPAQPANTSANTVRWRRTGMPGQCTAKARPGAMLAIVTNPKPRDWPVSRSTGRAGWASQAALDRPFRRLRDQPWRLGGHRRVVRLGLTLADKFRPHDPEDDGEAGRCSTTSRRFSTPSPRPPRSRRSVLGTGTRRPSLTRPTGAAVK